MHAIIPPWQTENILLPRCNSALSQFLPQSGGFAPIVPDFYALALGFSPFFYF